MIGGGKVCLDVFGKRYILNNLYLKMFSENKIIKLKNEWLGVLFSDRKFTFHLTIEFVILEVIGGLYF